MREELVAKTVGKQKTLATGMQQVHFLAVPVGLRAARAEWPHAHVHERGEARGDRTTIQASRLSFSQRRVIDEDVGVRELLLQYSPPVRRGEIAYPAVLAARQRRKQGAMARARQQRRRRAQGGARRRLEHHDLCSHGSQQSTCIGRRNGTRVLDDAAACQREIATVR